MINRMPNSTNLNDCVAGLEIGTAKICAVIARPGADGKLELLGIGQSCSRGVRGGKIFNPEVTAQEVREAVLEAELMAGGKIPGVNLGVTGGHIHGLNQRGARLITSADHMISDEDVQEVLKNAKAIHPSLDNNIIHAIRSHFKVDGKSCATNPAGMPGTRLEVDVHIIHGRANQMKDFIRLVRAIPLDVDEIVFNGLASAIAVLNTEQKKLGALVIDIGAGTTEYIAFENGVIRHSGALKLGGNRISFDLADELRISPGEAETLKLEHGSARVTETAKDRHVSVTDKPGNSKFVTVEFVQKHVSRRLIEIFQRIAQKIKPAKMADRFRAGVILCGGVARTPDILILAEEVFHLSAMVGINVGTSRLTVAKDSPEFATALGLARCGTFQKRKSSTKL